MNNIEEKIIKEKAEFINKNAVSLYFMRNYKKYHDSYTVEELLLSILLSDKPLEKCPRYNEMNDAIFGIDESIFNPDLAENYALKIIFSATRYLNSLIKKPETGVNLRNRIRRYCTYIDNKVSNSEEVVILEDTKEKVKVKKEM